MAQQSEPLVWGKKPVYTAAEVAAMLGVNVGKVNAFFRLGLLPYINFGHRVVRHEDLARFLWQHVGEDLTHPENVAKIPGVASGAAPMTGGYTL